MDELKQTFIKNLKRIHAASGLKQRFLAEQLTTHENTVRFWFSGRNFPSTENIVKLASLYGVHWLEFFIPEESEDSPDSPLP